MGYTNKKVKQKNISVLEGIIQEVWQEKDLKKAKSMVEEGLKNSKIKKKEQVLQNVREIKTKSRLDYYLANSLLYFEGHSTNIL